MDLSEQKLALRQQMRAVRKSITPQARKEAEDAIAERLFNLPAVRKAQCVAVYQAAGSEASVNDLVKALRLVNSSVSIGYPAITGAGIMHFARVDAGEFPAFLADPLVIMDPRDLDERRIDPQQIEILLVPGIAFDEQCRRLGQGGGFYDRYLEILAPDCITIGIAFEEQIIEQVPSGIHDKRVNYVVTPKRLITA